MIGSSNGVAILKHDLIQLLINIFLCLNGFVKLCTTRVYKHFLSVSSTFLIRPVILLANTDMKNVYKMIVYNT